jgi:hypothetical protein
MSAQGPASILAWVLRRCKGVLRTPGACPPVHGLTLRQGPRPHDALNQATALREQAKAAQVGSAALFAQAREQVPRALALVENGPADDMLKTQVARLQTELDEEKKDRRLVTALDEARLAKAESSGDRHSFAEGRAVPKSRKAFRECGLPAGQSEPKVAAGRIRQRPAAIREAIVVALHEWDALAADKTFAVSEPHREWLRAVSEAVEPAEGWTRQLRADRQETHKARRRTALEKLAAASRDHRTTGPGPPPDDPDYLRLLMWAEDGEDPQREPG